MFLPFRKIKMWFRSVKWRAHPSGWWWAMPGAGGSVSFLDCPYGCLDNDPSLQVDRPCLVTFAYCTQFQFSLAKTPQQTHPSMFQLLFKVFFQSFTFSISLGPFSLYISNQIFYYKSNIHLIWKIWKHIGK